VKFAKLFIGETAQEFLFGAESLNQNQNRDKRYAGEPARHSLFLVHDLDTS
jgi:hypothetical protein